MIALRKRCCLRFCCLRSFAFPIDLLSVSFLFDFRISDKDKYKLPFAEFVAAYTDSHPVIIR